MSRGLDCFTIVQTFSNVHLFSRGWRGGDFRVEAAAFTRRSVVSAIASGLPAQACLSQSDVEPRVARYAKGLSWAARRELLDAHGFYDAGIIGGGTGPMACACYGCFEGAMRIQCMNEPQRQRYLAWAEPFYAAVRDAVGFVEGDLFHLWHGDHHNRDVRARHAGLAAFAFNPFEDIAIDAQGCWRWNTAKREMHEYVRSYFEARREDG